LDNEILLDAYGGVFIMLWTAIREDVKHDREARNPGAMKVFEKMYNAAVKHWTKNRSDITTKVDVIKEQNFLVLL
jgi:hypothetical protein